jgi:hypothetical protein
VLTSRGLGNATNGAASICLGLARSIASSGTSIPAIRFSPVPKSGTKAEDQAMADQNDTNRDQINIDRDRDQHDADRGDRRQQDQDAGTREDPNRQQGDDTGSGRQQGGSGDMGSQQG